MIRKILLSAALAFSTVTGLTVPTLDANAYPPIERHHRHVRFEVLYRHRGHWDSFGTYRDRDDAERAAWRLRREGHEVRIERDFVR